MKQRWLEQLEDQKDDWIREQLEDPNANEDTDEWAALSEKYDILYSDSRMEFFEDDWHVEGISRLELFEENIRTSTETLALSSKVSNPKGLFVMLHTHVITAVEAYLSSTFIDNALRSDVYMKRLVENDPQFGSRKLTLKELFTMRSSLKDDLQQYLKDLIFHDIAKVRLMYKSVFEIDFGDVRWLFQAVDLRHDCVHRAGFDKDGNEVSLNNSSIERLIEDCKNLIYQLESAINSMPVEWDSIWEEYPNKNIKF